MPDRPIFNDLTSPDRSHGWRRVIFRFGIWQIIHRFWIRLRVEGWGNIPAEGPLIMMGNHVSAIDPLVMISMYPGRDIVPMAKIDAFTQPFFRYFVGHWGAIPVDRGAADRRALRLAIEAVRRGDVVMLYAEGTRSKTGMIRGQEGSAYIATRTNATVVPVAIWGGQNFPRVWWQEGRRAHIMLRFGQPFRFEWEGRARQYLRQMTDEAMYRIAELLPPDLRGVYADPAQATADLIVPCVDWQPTPETHIPSRVLIHD